MKKKRGKIIEQGEKIRRKNYGKSKSSFVKRKMNKNLRKNESKIKKRRLD